MPVPDDMTIEPDPAPPPVSTYRRTFHLDADPGHLEDTAEAMRAIGEQAAAAMSTLDTAARKIDAEGAWTGDTADAFSNHRTRLSGDLGLTSDAAVDAADTLDRIAGVLRLGQAQLDEQWDRLAAVSVTVRPGHRDPDAPDGPVLVFQPRDDAEAATVSDAISAAGEIRTNVDDELATHAATLRRILIGSAFRDPRADNNPGLAAISDTWRPQPVRVLDLNVGQGKGNVPWGWPVGDEAGEGTDPGDIDEIGQVIADSGASVVTLQEMFEGNAEDLERWLNENTDGEWTLHFETAEHKMQWDDAVSPFSDESGMDDFGNAVLVRTGGGVGEARPQAPVVLQEPAWGDIDVEGGIDRDGPQADVDVGGPEGRVLQHTEVQLEDR